ncbi:MAG: DUF1552 domain-containing protein [Polyangiaceae bacterium]|jgi:hypothetical protein|nr:DUF1552 domain-containing protein [Polyangiaceae bacterium]
MAREVSRRFERVARRRVLKMLGYSALALPIARLLWPEQGRAAPGPAQRVIFFYFPDGVAGPSQDGQPSLWHPGGSETGFSLTQQLEPLGDFRNDCVFLNGLSMGPTDSGSHPGGAKKLLTAADGGQNESIDRYLARTVGKGSPFQMLYLGAQATLQASGDKFISYISPGTSVAPQDSPREAFSLVFPGGNGASGSGGSGGGSGGGAPALEGSVLDTVLEDLNALRSELGATEKVKLDVHADALRETEKRIKGEVGTPPNPAAGCGQPQIDTSGFTDQELNDPARFPAIFRAQIDLLVLAMECGRTRVGTLQGSSHTSELIMSRFPGTEMYDPGFDMRSHQASHYGAKHDPNKREFADYVKQRRWWVSRFAYLLGELKKRPDGAGQSMLDTSLVLLCTEVCDGNTHLHDNIPMILAGRGGGLKTGRLLQYSGERHGRLFVSMANALGDGLGGFGDAANGPLPGLFG